ncbi:hypothetical protein ACFL3G_02785 [Planctomycetota bacterium]
MKKILFTIFIFVLLFNCAVLCGKNNSGKNNKGNRNQDKNDVRKKRMLEKKIRTMAAMRDANDPEALSRKRKMERKRSTRQLKERGKMRQAQRTKRIASQSDPNMAARGFGRKDIEAMRRTQKQANKEMIKHRKRLAKLGRIRELAVDQADEKTIARVNQMLQKEARRHDRKLMHIRQIRDRAGKSSPRGPQDSRLGAGAKGPQGSRKGMKKRADKEEILELKKKKAKLKKNE